jgi:hypothetical protein
MDVLPFETQTIKTSSSIAYPHWTVPSDVHYHASTLGPGLVLRQKNWWSRKSNVRKQRTIDDRATVRHLRTIVLGNCVIKAQVKKTSLGRGCDGQGTSRIVLTL